jgi:hypothetical protein
LLRFRLITGAQQGIDPKRHLGPRACSPDAIRQ